MCFATAAAISAGLAVAGTAVSVIGTLNQGAAAAAQRSYQAQIARNNAIVANQMADAEIKAGVREAEMKSLETGARMGKLKAAQAASGVDVNTGSTVDVQTSERMLGALDADTALTNAQTRAYGYRSRAANLVAEGGLYDRAAGDARTGSYLSAAGTILSRASSLPYKDIFGSSSGPKYDNSFVVGGSAGNGGLATA